MKTIWKYKIPLEDKFSLELPKDAVILTVQIQQGVPQLWVMVNTENEVEKRYFWLQGTGQEIYETDRVMKYINTFQLYGSALILHLFEVK